jgi:hypothetical protein
MSCTAKVPGVELLPPLFQRWVEQLFDGPIPAETAATCSSCAMCSPDAPRGDASHFDPRIKCCTYMPSLASFLVGRVLLDHDPASAHGRATMVERIHKRVGVTPMGVQRSRMDALLYREACPPSFGRSEALRCPHYVSESGSCGVWKHRESMCATWFCKHVRGTVGFEFWREGVHPLLVACERALARWCALELEVGDDAIFWLMAPVMGEAKIGREIDGVVDESWYAARWGNWMGREEAYFEACARKVDPLSWNDVMTIGGAEVKAHAAAARRAYAKLVSHDLPERVHVPELRIVRGDAETVQLRGYSDYDPVELPRAALEVLPRLSGNTTECLAKLAEDGVEIDPAFIRQLVDFGVLSSD